MFKYQLKSEVIQEMHSCGDEIVDGPASLKLKVYDAGGGTYVVMNANELAISDAVDLEELFSYIRNFMEQMPNQI